VANFPPFTVAVSAAVSFFMPIVFWMKKYVIGYLKLQYSSISDAGMDHGSRDCRSEDEGNRLQNLI
jgi:hypothetical protein